MDDMHAVGDIVTKISTDCVISLHVASLITCLLHGFIICWITERGGESVIT